MCVCYCVKKLFKFVSTAFNYYSWEVPRPYIVNKSTRCYMLLGKIKERAHK